MPDRLTIRCATESRVRGEELLGTASRVRRWLVVEQPGPWGREAPIDSRMDAAVARTLQSSTRRHGVRVLLVRRPGWRQDGGPRRVYLAHTASDGGWIEQHDLDDPHDVLHLDLSRLGDDVAPGLGTPGPPLVNLVCTNGRHDPCCADRGRPVIRALADAGTDEVWESSHVGGDRFAANVVCLPLGVYFGRVEADEAPRLLDDLASGLLDLDRFRGRSCYTPLIQAAEIVARRELGERRLAALEVTGAKQAGDDEAVVLVRHEGRRRYRVVVGRERARPEPLTCAANGNARPWRYLARGFEPEEP